MNATAAVTGTESSVSWVERVAARVVLAAMRRWRAGALTLILPNGEAVEVGDPVRASEVTVTIRDWMFFRRVLAAGEIGVAESYIEGEVEASDLVTLCMVFLRDQSLAPHRTAWTLPARLWHRCLQWARANTLRGSRRNIVYHYDLSNDLYRLFLDDDMLYSCAVFAAVDEPLEVAQRRKVDEICRQLDLRPGMKVLEIGCGWGALALHAAGKYGCQVTGITLSDRQLELARERVAAAGLADRVTLELCDYRCAVGCYDRIVSIEMFEAVGYENYAAFFEACNNLLAPAGRMLLQTITVPDQRFDAYRREFDWIRKHIFPGGLLASVAAIIDSIRRHTDLRLEWLRDIGPHYALTLRAWRQRFLANLPAVSALGFDARFVRMWELYLASCEAAFAVRHIGDAQLVLAKPGT
ncbi:cyclopropane-fatty-acyl-phospholipid synthase family protein [Candidatus Binatia bacterium]|nr:cyclopropane-fatty-acyl-phospholipid synthase family protein [Candidatus Binatia bacterium]